MNEWFYSRIGEKIVVRTMRDPATRIATVMFVKTDCVCLRNELSVNEWFPFTSLDFFRDAL